MTSPMDIIFQLVLNNNIKYQRFSEFNRGGIILNPLNNYSLYSHLKKNDAVLFLSVDIWSNVECGVFVVP